MAVGHDVTEVRESWQKGSQNKNFKVLNLTQIVKSRHLKNAIVFIRLDYLDQPDFFQIIKFEELTDLEPILLEIFFVNNCVFYKNSLEGLT